MNIYPSLLTKAIGISITAIFLTGCASSTLLKTNPAGAAVFIKGEKLGKTPFEYSDNKVAFSSTLITFKKVGYYDLDTVLKRNEEPDPIAILGGVAAIVPAFWFLKYKPLHYYELTKDSSVSPIINIPGPAQLNDLISDTSVIIDRVIIPESNKTYLSMLGLGMGAGLSGMISGIHYNFVSSKNLGAGVSYKMTLFKSEDVPADYFDDGWRVFYPRDYLNILSFNLTAEFPNPGKSSRFGFELGPSLVNYSKAVIKPNPLYPGTLIMHKYLKSHSGTNGIGASFRAKMTFLATSSLGLDLALFANVNTFKSFIGFEFYIILGDIKN